MSYVAEIVVVEEDYLHGSLLLHDGTKLLYAHLERSVASEEADGAVGCTEGGSNGSRQSEAHGAESATRHDAEFATIMEIAA